MEQHRCGRGGAVWTGRSLERSEGPQPAPGLAFGRVVGTEWQAELRTAWTGQFHASLHPGQALLSLTRLEEKRPRISCARAPMPLEVSSGRISPGGRGGPEGVCAGAGSPRGWGGGLTVAGQVRQQHAEALHHVGVVPVPLVEVPEQREPAAVVLQHHHPEGRQLCGGRRVSALGRRVCAVLLGSGGTAEPAQGRVGARLGRHAAGRAEPTGVLLTQSRARHLERDEAESCVASALWGATADLQLGPSASVRDVPLWGRPSCS